MNSQTSDQQLSSSSMAFLLGGGEMGALIRAHDWERTSLGSPMDWPQSLRTAVNILLTSRYAMWLGWGKSLHFIYNDAYRPTLGIKHPWALGRPASEVWAEIWRDIGPRIETVLSTGEATYDAGLLLFLERSGFPEETYHTFSYSPLRDDAGQISGMLCVVTEETDRVINERRLATLRDLAAGLAASSTESEVLHAVEQQLGANLKDLPFTLTYFFESNGQARLARSTGIEIGHAAAPSRIEAGANQPWPADEMRSHPASRTVDGLTERLRPAVLPTGAWDRAPEQAAVVPIKQQGHGPPAGFLVIGVNPYRRYGDDYRGFVELAAGQVAAGLSNAREYEVERARAEALAELDRAKTVFFSNVSHEFRTPLTLMLGPVEDMLASPEQMTAKSRESLQLVHRSGLRLQRLVNTLLDFSRIEAGRSQASYELVDLAAVTADLASSFRSAMERAGLQYTVDCTSLSAPVYVDLEMWEKVVLNLISNAFKYTLAGSVTVRLSEREHSAELSITDSGVGIPEQELPHLFERFHRVEGTRARTHEGTGIGLALVQELVKLHGGSVRVASEYGYGSTFTVAIPLGREHLPQERLGARRKAASTALHAETYVQEAMQWLPAVENVARDKRSGFDDNSLTGNPEVESIGIAGPRSRVLLADDNRDMRDYVRRLLSPNYDVVAVANGDEALTSALAHQPDLVLTDVMMPVLDGFGLLKALRSNERTRTIPILLLSARAGEESRVEGLDAGADDYVVKPFSARELLARVEAHLSLARMRRQADQARRLSEARLGLALESTRMVAWEWDPEKDEVVGLGDMENLFGTAVRNHEDSLRLLHPADEQEHRAKVARVAREGGQYHSEFRIYRHGTGHVAWLEERATGLTDETGKVIRLVGVISDVTERKAAEEELRRKNEELTRVNRELEEFAYVASHDLQEPLRMVNIYSQLLLRHSGPAEHAASVYAEFVRKGVYRMEELIKDLLSYSRVVHPDQDTAQPANLDHSLDEALAVLRARVEETGATILRSPLPVVLGEERQLALVFQNLISNALKYQSSGTAPRIEITVEEGNHEHVVRVRDNGIGFDPQHADRIFGLFKRLHQDAYPGTGLGLAICKRIIERYRGRIWGESEGDGKGAVFSFTLPLDRR